MSLSARPIAHAAISPSRWLASIALMAAALLALWPGAAGSQPLSQTGDWRSTGDLGVIGAHVAVLKDPTNFSTKVYLMGGFGSGHQHRLWQFVPSAALTIPDPLTNFLNPGLPPPPPLGPPPPPEQEPPSGFVDTFCSGHVVLPNGQLLLVGGEYSTPYGTELSYTLDPSWSGTGSAWTRRATMAQERWYPAVTSLARGEALVTAGIKHAYMMTFGGLEGAGAPSSSLKP
ncbi:MAG: hypothetical protein ACREMG_14260, partial [Gemmatimonadales bacterium]